MPNQTAFGGMLQAVVERDAIVFRPEPLDVIVERRCKRAWDHAPCPEYGDTAIQTRDDSPRVWCHNCRYVFTYTRNTPFENTQLTPGELLLIFILYADTLLSINQIAYLVEPCYDTIHSRLREGEAAFERGFPLVWNGFNRRSMVSPRSMKLGDMFRLQRAIAATSRTLRRWLWSPGTITLGRHPRGQADARRGQPRRTPSDPGRTRIEGSGSQANP